LTGNIALDIFIGLVFVYLLYSLFAAVLLEIISTNLSMRSRNLRKAIFTMLNDEQTQVSIFKKIQWTFMRLLGGGTKHKSGGLAQALYDSSGIKHLTNVSWGRSYPSGISSAQFSKALIKVMTDQNAENRTEMANQVKSFLELPQSQEDLHATSESGKDYLLFLFREANGDLEQFAEKVELWFDEMMLSATEWYKKNMQIWLFLIGLVLAYAFNLNSLYIAKYLSLNNKARSQMVQLAGDYIERTGNDLPQIDSFTVEEVNNYYEELKAQTYQAAAVFGLPKALPNRVKIERVYASVDAFNAAKKNSFSFAKDKNGRYWVFQQPQTLPYINIGKYVCFGKSPESGKMVDFNATKFFLYYQLWGYIITALAISLGAPFWFDLLNKLMQLRGNVPAQRKQATQVKK
tara:strand:- start:4488 stop:5699 length:1212 start_codon:yes stop_codon:yes gene_type:complete